MPGNRYINRSPRRGVEPKIGRMFLVSCGLHLLALLVFMGLPSSTDSVRRPVYYVDLTRMPVADPQAGRPDARPPEKKKTKAPAVRTRPAVKPPTKAAPKLRKTETPTTTVPTGPSDADIARKIEKLRDEQEREAMKAKLAALAADDRRGEDSGVDAPLGMPDAKGTEAGVDQLAWLQDFLRENWTLSPYQVQDYKLTMKVQLVYRGRNLSGYNIIEPSGDAVFDKSVRDAINKANTLGFDPVMNPWQVEVVFNLKELMNR